METTFTKAAPHEEALSLLRGKPAVAREVFDGLLPDLRGRAFTVAGVTGAGTLQRCRDAVAGIAEGATWPEAKQQLLEELEPFLGDGAAMRAEVLLRTHGFQAFQAAAWRTAQEDADTTHLQYLTMEDDRVRDTHAALDGVVLPKDDPFWQKHYPPWEWGCRCLVRSMNVDQVKAERRSDLSRNPEDRNVVEGAAKTQLQNGTLIRNGRRYDVTAPSDRPGADTAFQWHPDNLRLPLADLQARYEPAVWRQFREWADRTRLSGRQTVLEWLESKSPAQ